MPRTTAALTSDQAKARIRATGMTITEWARRHGFRRHDVYLVLSGTRKGHFGLSHQIAVALGMKKSTPAEEISNPQSAKAA